MTQTTGEPIDQGILVDALATLSADNERLRKFVQQVADAPDAMVCRLTRDAAKEVLDAN